MNDKTANAAKTAAIIGAGVIGSGWLARFVLMGWNATVYDPSPEARKHIEQTLSQAKRSLPGLYDTELPLTGHITYAPNLADAVKHAHWIQESVGERLDLKLAVIKEIEAHAHKDAIIASSTSGFTPTNLRDDALNHERIIVAHPFNPVYLLPLVEVVGEGSFSASACDILRSLGMHPLHIRKEIDAHIADRIMEAAWREALWLIHDNVASSGEIDDAIRYGFGLRWAQMGIFDTWRLAGGEAGMEHFLKQFGPALKWPWTKLMDTPELSDDLIKRIVDQSEAQSGHLSHPQMVAVRDNNLVSILRALKGQNFGAGSTISRDESKRKTSPREQTDGSIITARRAMPLDWTDYNGHVNEARYGQAFSDASDEILQHIGLDESYIAKGYSWFTVENRITYVHETKAGQTIEIRSRIPQAEGKKLKIQHDMFLDDGTVLARCDTLLLHVDLNLRKSCIPLPEMSEQMSKLTISSRSTD